MSAATTPNNYNIDNDNAYVSIQSSQGRLTLQKRHCLNINKHDKKNEHLRYILS